MRSMKWAVEAKAFGDGRIVARVRPAREDEENGCTETRMCDVWIDLFDNETDARQFCREYRR